MIKIITPTSVFWTDMIWAEQEIDWTNNYESTGAYYIRCIAGGRQHTLEKVPSIEIAMNKIEYFNKLKTGSQWYVRILHLNTQNT